MAMGGGAIPQVGINLVCGVMFVSAGVHSCGAFLAWRRFRTASGRVAGDEATGAASDPRPNPSPIEALRDRLAERPALQVPERRTAESPPAAAFKLQPPAVEPPSEG